MRMLMARSTVVYSCTGLLLLLVFSMFLNRTPNTTGVLSTWTKQHGLPTPVLDTATIVEVTNKHSETQSSNDLDTPEVKSVALQTNTASPPIDALEHNLEKSLSQTHKNPKEFEAIATKNNGKLVLLTGATGPGHFQKVENFHQKVTSNRREYANKHGILCSNYILTLGYDFMTVNLSSYLITHTTHPVWGKLPAILEAFEKYPQAEWVWWLDIDAIIMSPEVDLYTSFLDPSIIQSKLAIGDPILILDDLHSPIRSGLQTSVSSLQ